MEHAKEILGTAMRRMGHPASRMEWLRATWRLLAGESLARHTKPLRLDDGRLEVGLLVSGEENALRGLEEELRGRINRAWGRAPGRPLVREVYFSPVRANLPYALDNAHTPFVRKGKASLAGGKERK
jgi:hypothetical protein